MDKPKRKYNSRGHLLSGDMAPCDKCGKLTDLHLLDSKDDGTGNWTVLQCEQCYGPGWLPFASKSNAITQT